MNNSKNVSIVIPTFNRAKMLKRAVDSALAQSVKCEVIVCDHGSTDDTPELMRSYGEKIRYLRRELDNGPFFCWLDGVINAKHELVHLNFDDDWIDPEFIEKTLNVMTDDCAFAFSSVSTHGENGKIQNLYLNLFETGIHKKAKLEKFLLNSQLTISPGCAIFRKESIINAIFIGKVPLTKIHYHGVGPDLLMFLLPLLDYKKFGFVNQILAHFDAHENSITVNSNSSTESQKKILNAYEDVKKYYQLLSISKKYDLQNRIYQYFKLKNKIKNFGRKLLSKISH